MVNSGLVVRFGVYKNWFWWWMCWCNLFSSAFTTVFDDGCLTDSSPDNWFCGILLWVANKSFCLIVCWLHLLDFVILYCVAIVSMFNFLWLLIVLALYELINCQNVQSGLLILFGLAFSVLFWFFKMPLFLVSSCVSFCTIAWIGVVVGLSLLLRSCRLQSFIGFVLTFVLLLCWFLVALCKFSLVISFLCFSTSVSSFVVIVDPLLLSKFVMLAQAAMSWSFVKQTLNYQK